MPSKKSTKRQKHTSMRRRTDTTSRALELHKKYGGKLETRSRIPLTPDSLKLIYTPGVGDVASYLAEHPEETSRYTGRGRTVAIVSDGSAVLGLGNIGPEGALPVMEGKAVLFKELAGLDAVPIVLNTQNPDDIVDAVTAIAPSFGAINLEDISAPYCFSVEERLIQTLSIPVLHDDQHGTAIVVLAGLLNAHKVVGKSLETSRIAVIGAGAAGTAITKLLLAHGVGDVVVVDTHGILSTMRTNLKPHEQELMRCTNAEGRFGGVLEAVAGADAVIGVSVPGTITQEHIRRMAQHPIVFALANPVPEIMPDVARAAGAVVVATGRSDFPNQVNNALAFPGIFKGALEHGVRGITEDMKLRAAYNLAGAITRPTANKILPTIFDKRVVPAVAKAIR
jgi:malate dehydrogenase (oxaloacetate-decarboxylating)